jgi:hypothetical protein
LLFAVLAVSPLWPPLLAPPLLFPLLLLLLPPPLPLLPEPDPEPEAPETATVQQTNNSTSLKNLPGINFLLILMSMLLDFLKKLAGKVFERNPCVRPARDSSRSYEQ